MFRLCLIPALNLKLSVKYRIKASATNCQLEALDDTTVTASSAWISGASSEGWILF